jgi:hypothetical protein
LIGKTYQLLVNVGALKQDVLVSADAKPLESILKRYKRVRVDVSLIGKSFRITPNVRPLWLTTERNSEPISFSVTPKQKGHQNLSMFFYYKLNLLLVLCVPLEVISKPTIYSKTGNKLLNTHIIGSSDRGFESIFEIDKAI